MARETCVTCSGWGVTGSVGNYVTCLTCGGSGVSETAGTVTIRYDFPELVTPTATGAELTSRVLRYGATFIALATTLAAASYLSTTSVAFSDFIWGRGIAHVIFGVGGLVSMYCVTLFEQRRTSTRTLADLSALSGTIPLSDVANPRVGSLLHEAAALAATRHESAITEQVFLLALLKNPRIQSIVARLEHDPADIIASAEQLIGSGQDVGSGPYAVSPEVRSIIFQALTLAGSNHFPYLDIEDILLAYANMPTWQDSLFKQFELTPVTVLALAKWYADDTERRRRWAFWREKGRTKPKGHMNRAWTALPTPFLDQYSRDITSLAAQGAIAATLARDTEVDRCLQVLGNPTNRNLLLLGEVGVGKGTVIDGIAFRMVEERVPEVLRDHRLVELDIATLLSSGNGEQNVRAVLDEVQQAGNVILAIPEVQSLSATTDGPLDAAALLASALKQGAVQVITSATYADYHRYVEQNASLTSILTVVEVKPPTKDQTVAILEEEAATIESREDVLLTFPAIEAAAELAERYLTDQVLPQSAITLLGEAASAVKATGKHWVHEVDIQQTIEKRTGIPVQPAGTEEGERLLHLEDELHTRIIGQEQAVVAVANALRRARAGLHSNDRPIASFLFVGPTGVGKTEMAKAVAGIYFGNEDAFIRLDMSEYQDGTAVYRLIGAPPGSSDALTEGGALTQPIREHPFTLLLLDEIEKAHPDVLNLFLQLLDDGRLTENTGRTVHFRNAIVVATSNAGSSEIIRLIQEKVNPDMLSKQVLSLLQQSFKPEFLNRFDAIIPFSSLTAEEAQQVTSLLLKPVIASAAEQGITLTFNPDAVAYLTQVGYDPQFGGRPLRRVIQDKVEAWLAKQLLSGAVEKGQSIEITAQVLR